MSPAAPEPTLHALVTRVEVLMSSVDRSPARIREEGMALGRRIFRHRREGDMGPVSVEMRLMVNFARECLTHMNDTWEIRALLACPLVMDLFLFVTRDTPGLDGRAELLQYREETLAQFFAYRGPLGVLAETDAWRDRVTPCPPPAV
jgi:hypothetical protein